MRTVCSLVGTLLFASTASLVCGSCSRSATKPPPAKAPIKAPAPASRVDLKSYRYICEGRAAVQGSGKAADDAALVRARQVAVNATMSLIASTRVDGKQSAKTLMGNPVVRRKIYIVVSAQKPGLSKIATLGGQRMAVVWLSVPMRGKNAPESILLSEMIRVSAKGATPPTDTIIEGSEKVAMNTEKPARSGGKDGSDARIGYTSLILDATGIKIQRTMGPRILKENGEVVWTGEGADLEDVQEFGITAYCKSLDAAKQNPRAGVRPLIVRVIRPAGAQACDVLISDADAVTVLEEEKKCGFLGGCNVIIASD